MFHCVIIHTFIQPPIWGLDVIAELNKVTGFFTIGHRYQVKDKLKKYMVEWLKKKVKILIHHLKLENF